MTSPISTDHFTTHNIPTVAALIPGSTGCKVPNQLVTWLDCSISLYYTVFISVQKQSSISSNYQHRDAVFSDAPSHFVSFEMRTASRKPCPADWNGPWRAWLYRPSPINSDSIDSHPPKSWILVFSVAHRMPICPVFNCHSGNQFCLDGWMDGWMEPNLVLFITSIYFLLFLARPTMHCCHWWTDRESK